jgi:hypothetical protein
MKWLKRALIKLIGLDSQVEKLDYLVKTFNIMAQNIEHLRVLNAQYLIDKIKSQGLLKNIQNAEFKVFSQFGDDGIIQYLINHIPIENKSFIEFGVQNYTESNTRFLLINNNWRGLIIEADKANIEYIINDEISWRYELTAIESFITKANINTLISQNGVTGEIGLLSIDIDGNDYWIWESISVVNPIIVIVEYNSVFGSKSAVTIPYDPDFRRNTAHSSNLYYGCSLKALCLLGMEKDYYFIGSNSAGNNAYFIRKDKIGLLEPQSVEEGYVESKFRESRNRNGDLTYLSGVNRLRVIAEMDVFDIERIEIKKIKDIIV